MSAIGGYFQRTDASPPRGLLRRLSAGLEPLGSDSAGYETTPRVGMVHRDFVAAGEANAQQPKLDARGFLVAVDGWIDNGAELEKALGLSAGQDSTSLVLEAYRQWGLDGFARLVGAFAFSLWDPHERRLILAADSLGFRPLYLHVSDKTVVFASKARALLDALEITPQADLDFIAAFLTNSITDRGPYDGVETVPGGHLMVIDDAGVRRHRYWHFDPAKEIRYRSESEYEEHFNELFDEAIACRMRSAGPVFAELSGGVDSSSIV